MLCMYTAPYLSGSIGTFTQLALHSHCFGHYLHLAYYNVPSHVVTMEIDPLIQLLRYSALEFIYYS